jgi:hypothetical protein
MTGVMSAWSGSSVLILITIISSLILAMVNYLACMAIVRPKKPGMIMASMIRSLSLL